ncbi:MAG: phage integrase N-terminal SAM-like domain-containing protein [Gammaproteobacteria bacterium]|nr:phage integrase N-terminal SAM-like domain-containing protein [Gammaproteobacteria bacterium]
MKRHVLFHGKRHSRDMGATHVERFLSHLAIERELSASTQNAGNCGIAHSCRRHRGPGSRRQWRQG